MSTEKLLDQVGDRTVAALLGDLLARVAVLESKLQNAGAAGAEIPQVADGPDQLALALNSRLAALLVAGGFGSLAAVRAASDAELLGVAGATERAVKLIREKVG